MKTMIIPPTFFKPYSGVSSSLSNCLRKKCLVLFFIVVYEYDSGFKLFGKVFHKGTISKETVSHESTIAVHSIYKYICSLNREVAHFVRNVANYYRC